MQSFPRRLNVVSGGPGDHAQRHLQRDPEAHALVERDRPGVGGDDVQERRLAASSSRRTTSSVRRRARPRPWYRDACRCRSPRAVAVVHALAGHRDQPIAVEDADVARRTRSSACRTGRACVSPASAHICGTCSPRSGTASSVGSSGGAAAPVQRHHQHPRVALERPARRAPRPTTPSSRSARPARRAARARRSPAAPDRRRR